MGRAGTFRRPEQDMRRPEGGVGRAEAWQLVGEFGVGPDLGPIG